MTTPVQTSTTTTRLQWADAAKGLCVALVVLGHVTFFDYLDVVQRAWPQADRAQLLWSLSNQVLRPLRMPLFFAVAGFFAVRALQRPWPVVRRPRVATYAYLHVVWFAVWALAALAAGALVGAGVLRGGLGLVVPPEVPQLLLAAAVGGVGPWFLYALALYFVVGRLTRRLPAPLVVGVAALVAVAAFARWLPAPLGVEPVLENGVWYLAAARYPDVLRRWIARPRPARTALVWAAYVAVNLAVWRLAPPAAVAAVLEMPVRLLAVAASVHLAVLAAAALPRLAAPWVRLGRRTLPVYVLHPPLLFLLHVPLLALAEHVLRPLPGPLATAAALLYPAVVTAGLVLLAVAVHDLLQRAGAGWLFALPGGSAPRGVQLPPDPARGVVPAARPAQQQPGGAREPRP
ncbi:acyltransferase family protein [Kineococcus glutinatus]|uniref:Acyltransferase 3 domain-containing protein n=1 Tax=Kineococcus glutinatus TaxID=1070872 RepID=A0ABP9HDP7_9ACTN